MKVALLAATSSIHTVRWANGLSAAGIDVVVISQHEPGDPIMPAIRQIRLPYDGGLGYFRNVPQLKRILSAEEPDLLHAHYASGYGTTARLSRFRPLLLSVWGSDVYDFPTRSPLHGWWLRGNLTGATQVASTSNAMAARTRAIARDLGEIAVTPFGVDMAHFSPRAVPPQADTPIVIGTVKTLSDPYGIDTLIDSVAMLAQRLRREAPALASRLRVRIVGDGPLRAALEAQARTLDIADIVDFAGRVPHAQVPDALRSLDVYIALSRMESFGVAVIEAGACGLPVVVSDVGGLPEVVEHGRTGFVVPQENPVAAADALYRLVLDSDMRRAMGLAARERIASLYEWQANVRQMIALYESTIASGAKEPS